MFSFACLCCCVTELTPCCDCHTGLPTQSDLLSSSLHKKSAEPCSGFFKGYFSDTIMYYGFYTNATIQHGEGAPSYSMPLAYLFTIGGCLVICFFSLLFRYGGSAFLNAKLFLSLDKIQETRKLPRKQFLCNLPDHSSSCNNNKMSTDRGEKFLCVFKAIGQSKRTHAMPQGVLWTERHGWTIVS